MLKLAPSTPSAERSVDVTHLRGSTLLLAGRILATLVGFATQVLIVRYLSKQDFGAFAYGLSIAVLLQAILPLGLDRADARFMATYDERRDFSRLLGVLVVEAATILSLAAVALGVIYIAADSLSTDGVSGSTMRTLVLVLACLAPIGALDDMVGNAFAVFGSARAVFLRRYVVEPGLRLAVVAAVSLGGMPLSALATGYVLAGVAGGALYAALLLRLLRNVHATHGSPGWRVHAAVRALFAFAIPVAAGNLVNIAAVALPPTVLAHYASLADVAEIRAIQPIAMLNVLVSASFTTMFMPAATRVFLRAPGAGLREIYWSTAGWITVLTFPIFAMTFVFARPIIDLAFGQRYTHAAPYLAATSVALFVQAASGFNGLTVQVAGRVRYAFAANACALVFCVVATLLLVPTVHAVGAVAATVLTMLVHNLLKQLGLRRIGAGAWNRRYLPVYAWVVALTAVLLTIDRLVKPPLIIAILLVAVLSLVLVRRCATLLGLDETFPEIARLPLVRILVTASFRDARERRPRVGRRRPAVAEATVPSVAPEQRLAELDAWQRLDWRLLLPRPVSTTVAVAASVPSTMRDALRSCGFSTVAAEAAQGADAVIVCNPDRDELARAPDYLSTGAQLQIHIGDPAVVPLVAYRRRLRALRLTAVNTYWAIPRLDAPRMLVPLDERSAVRAALTRQGDAPWSLRALAAELLLRTRLIHLLARQGVIIARHADEPH